MRYSVLLLLSIVYTPALAGDLERARTHINSMDYANAITEIRTHLSQHPQDMEALHLLAKTYAWDNQYEQAEQTYDRLLLKEPDNTQFQFGKAQALIWQNKQAQAIPVLEGIRQHVPEQSDVWRLLILSLQQSANQQDKKRAVALAKEARQRFPNEFWGIASE